MELCEHCPYPHRCKPQQRCIAYKKDGVSVTLPEPVPHPVITSSGISMTGKIKTGKKKKAAKK